VPKHTTTVLRVAAKADGYRREGLKFSVASADIPLTLLSSAQLHRLMSDPMLSCEEVEVEPSLEISMEELAELRDMAAVGESIMVLIPHGTGSAADYVAHLQQQAMQLTEQAAVGAAVLALVPQDWTGTSTDYLAHLQAEVASHAVAPEPVKEALVHAGAKTPAKPHGK